MSDVKNNKTWSAKIAVFVGLFALFGLFGSFGGFVWWGIMTQIAGATISPGRIEVNQNRQIV